MAKQSRLAARDETEILVLPLKFDVVSRRNSFVLIHQICSFIMPSTSTRLPFAAQLFPGSRRSLVTASVVQSSNITRAPNLRWTKIEGPVHETLIRELQKMYWGGVKRELLHILLTLRKWQQMEFAGTTLVDEKMTLFKALILLSIMSAKVLEALPTDMIKGCGDGGRQSRFPGSRH